MVTITVDIGTTNSRIKVVEGDHVLATAKSEVGIKDVAITGSKTILEKGLSKIVSEGLACANKTIEEVVFFVASGMVTSNLGLVEIPHRICPVSMDDLAQGVVKREFEWLNNKPFFFIPGVKNNVSVPTMDNLDRIDVMRGEEVETFGVIQLCSVRGPALIILPGSHTKFVYINEKNEIEKCSTTMLGEFMHALATSTILSNSILSNLVTEVEEEYILKGMHFERNYGVTKSAFAVRLMDISLDTTPNQRANFLAGALICNDIGPHVLSDIKKRYKQIFIGGASPLKEMFRVVLENHQLNDTAITVIPDDITDRASSTGALMIVNRLYGN